MAGEGQAMPVPLDMGQRVLELFLGAASGEVVIDFQRAAQRVRAVAIDSQNRLVSSVDG
jgi:precorrin-6B methylase 2